MSHVPEIFGSMVFNESIMKARLPKETYRSLKQTIASEKPLDLEIANVVANAMKDWAVEKGVTHYTHWFQPMNGITAEKHDSFISPVEGGNIIMEFSGKELVRGESDASSFPSGGLRATFEARGYTAWDPTSYAFIKDGTLCIPTAFCSYGGEALDQKTPLLRSMEALERQCKRILKLFGSTDVKRVVPTVGAEQEYFLIDRDMYEKRPDLVYCGRTLFGYRPPKGQELDDHYFGALKPRVSSFMKELDEELWKLGVLAKTKHNEVAPAQHELAPIYATTNIATDHNQLTMELMKTVAARHGLACLLNEKPFAGVNGSGKHNNWSLTTNLGQNLFEPGDTPSENAQFLLFLTAMIKAVDEHQDLLRIAVASVGNDYRLGGNEAPSCIISMFVGDDLEAVIRDIIEGNVHNNVHRQRMEVGVTVLPTIPKDTTDRNRTSPFAFTGNKFEFRSVGSSQSIASANIVINTIFSDALMQFADKLEYSADLTAELNELIHDELMRHSRIIFNGNNYSSDWTREASKRGLLNLTTTVDALKLYNRTENIDLFEKQSVFTSAELHARNEILYENYCKSIHIEALTLTDMIRQEWLNASFRYQAQLLSVINGKKSAGIPTFEPEMALLLRISELTGRLSECVSTLEQAVASVEGAYDIVQSAEIYTDKVRPAMLEARGVIDIIESMLPKSIRPYPTYAELLYSVQ